MTWRERCQYQCECIGFALTAYVPDPAAVPDRLCNDFDSASFRARSYVGWGPRTTGRRMTKEELFEFPVSCRFK
jgi:hypothetical protein